MDPKTIVISLLIGYVFGMFLTADLVAWHYTGHNASTIGLCLNNMRNILPEEEKMLTEGKEVLA